MTSIRSTLGKLFGGSAAQLDGAPDADLVVAPSSSDEIARLLDFCSEHRLTVLPWGGGFHQGYGGRVTPDVIIATTRLDQIEIWEPDDLTVVAGAGLTLGELQSQIGERRQSAILLEDEPSATLGGVVAAGVSGWRRLRYGPIRERVLEVVIVTGDGRIVRGGAQVVKNVTGYGLPRLLTGSFGSLGVVTRLCLKLWPVPEAEATVVVGDAPRALATAYRPLAVLETRERATVHLSGTKAEVDAQAAALGGSVLEGLVFPSRPEGECVVRVRVPPALLVDGIRLLGGQYVAAHGVGEIQAAVDPASIPSLREWAESVGGSVVIERAPDDVYDVVDPWGAPPETVPLQRRIKAAFDPIGVLVPGRLPGGI